MARLPPRVGKLRRDRPVTPLDPRRSRSKAFVFARTIVFEDHPLEGDDLWLDQDPRGLPESPLAAVTHTCLHMQAVKDTRPGCLWCPGGDQRNGESLGIIRIEKKWPERHRRNHRRLKARRVLHRSMGNGLGYGGAAHCPDPCSTKEASKISHVLLSVPRGLRLRESAAASGCYRGPPALRYVCRDFPSAQGPAKGGDLSN